MPTNPPPGFKDIIGDADAESAVVPVAGPYTEIDVPEVGMVRARKPMANAIPNLAMSAASHIDNTARADHLMRFVRNHLDYGEADRLLVGMINGELPSDTFGRVGTTIATWGTARPT